MKIIRIAQTELSEHGVDAGVHPTYGPMLSFEEVISGYMDLDLNSTSAEDLIEFAGRGCYESWDKPNPETRSNFDYITKNIIEKEHFSVLEHASVSYRVEGVSRNMLLEFERHRHFSLSIISTRFVDASKLGVVIPPPLREFYDGESIRPLTDTERFRYESQVQSLMKDGLKRKQAREAARYELPGNLETRGVITGNLRAWREMILKRYNVHADAEIQEFAGLVLGDLRQYAPSVFADIPDQPIGSA